MSAPRVALKPTHTPKPSVVASGAQEKSPSRATKLQLDNLPSINGTGPLTPPNSVGRGMTAPGIRGSGGDARTMRPRTYGPQLVCVLVGPLASLCSEAGLKGQKLDTDLSPQ